MKPDILERLLMDRALGRLDPDAEVLLAGYLANDPAAATQARELHETVSLATEVMRHLDACDRELQNVAQHAGEAKAFASDKQAYAEHLAAGCKRLLGG